MTHYALTSKVYFKIFRYHLTPNFCDVTESWTCNYCNGYNIIRLLKKCYTERTGILITIPLERPVKSSGLNGSVGLNTAEHELKL